MKRDIVFAHKLIQFYIFILPPFFVLFLQELSCDGDVSNWSIEPDIKDLIFKLFNRDRNPPFQISGDTFIPETHVDPPISNMSGI